MTHPLVPQVRWFGVLVSLAALVTVASGQPCRVYVNHAATGSNDGSSWVDAFVHLQDALASAASCPEGAEVWVAAGVYRPDQSSANPAGTGDRAASFALRSNGALIGGFAGTETAVDQRVRSDPLDPTSFAAVSVLSGNLGSNNSIHVASAIGADVSAVLDGF